MTLKVIGSGFGRTGTMSTKMALEQLGFGPCHHMVEVMQNPTQPAFWNDLAKGKKVNWLSVFEGYNSQVDWPGAAVWQQTIEAFPTAKVIHTERPEDVWWNSFSQTIGKFFLLRDGLPLPPNIAEIFATMDTLFIKNTFGDLRDRTSAIAAYRHNNEMVRKIVPADRLLIFNVVDGWVPLCRLLGAKIPATPFPRSNARDEFWAHFGGEPTLT